MSQLHIIRTDSSNPDFVKLVEKLDSQLAITDGDEHEFYDQFNKLDNIKHVVLAIKNNEAVASGAIKRYDESTFEVKRMFTLDCFRGKGIASKILRELEIWSIELGYTRCILETGTRQESAIALYEKANYTRIPNYGQYERMENSLCFEKKLI